MPLHELGTKKVMFGFLWIHLHVQDVDDFDDDNEDEDEELLNNEEDK